MFESFAMRIAGLYDHIMRMFDDQCEPLESQKTTEVIGEKNIK